MTRLGSPSLHDRGRSLPSPSSQAACAAVAIPLQTEKFYDLSGAFTFISCTLVSLYYPAYRAKLPLPNILSFHPRQLVMSESQRREKKHPCCAAGLGLMMNERVPGGFTVLWAGRLGSFLFGVSFTSVSFHCFRRKS